MGWSKPLIPRIVILSAEAKSFGLERGKSFGSGMSMEFIVPEGIDRKELAKLILVEREKIELGLLVSQHVKGAITNEEYRDSRNQIKGNYEKLRGSINDTVKEKEDDKPAAIE